MKKIFFFLPLLLLINSCDYTDLDPTLFNEGFQGITRTSSDSPEPLGGDRSDWCSFYRMPKPGDENNNDVEVPFPIGYAFGPAYPNPSYYDASFVVPFSLQSDAHVNIYIIDKYYKVKKTIVNNLMSAGSYQYYVHGWEIGTGIFRVVFEIDNKVICTGDVWVKN
jgi:hypothetical protein